MRTTLILILMTLFVTENVAASESPRRKLDRPYRHLHQMIEDTAIPDPFRRLKRFFSDELPWRSDALSVIGALSPVRDQMERGTCSIFSATAAIEWLLTGRMRPTTPMDLSEQWLAYAVTVKNGEEGSEAPLNNRVIRAYGIPFEEELPYEGKSWEKIALESDPNLKNRCSHLTGRNLKVCRDAHYDPYWLEAGDRNVSAEFARARQSARQMQRHHLSSLSARSAVKLVTEVKELLAAGVPLILEFDFYHGAWQSSDMEEMGLGKQDRGAYLRGEVGFPEEDSLDRELSMDPEYEGGHSVMVVGYNDQETITTRQKMQDGSIQEFTYRGVYYIRNSWGTDTWGSQTRVNGYPRPGYGKITQRYAHRLGAFFQFQFE